MKVNLDICRKCRWFSKGKLNANIQFLGCNLVAEDTDKFTNLVKEIRELILKRVSIGQTVENEWPATIGTIERHQSTEFKPNDYFAFPDNCPYLLEHTLNDHD